MRSLLAALGLLLAVTACTGGSSDSKPADDPCAPNPCFAGGACTVSGGAATCGACPAGTAGDGFSCSDVDGCAGHTCLPSSTCADVAAPGTGYTCSACTGPSCPELRAQAGPDVTAVTGATVILSGSALGANGAVTCGWTRAGDPAVLAGCALAVQPAASTVYTLTVTDASGRTATDAVAITIAELVAEAGPGLNVAPGGSAVLRATFSGASCPSGACVTCAWKDGAGIAVADTCEASVSPQVTTAYVLTVTDGGNGRVATDTTTVFVVGEPARLCGWDVVVLRSNEYPSTPNPNYVCDANQVARRQTVNGKPAIVLSDLVVGNAQIVGYISVETTGDDDHIGFLWGWQDPRRAYLLSWKQLDQNWTAACGNAPAGIAVKKLDGAAGAPATITFDASLGYNATDYAYSCADLWSHDRANAALLGDDTIFLRAPDDPGGFATGWADATTYRFEFFHTPARTKVLVYRDEAVNGSTAEPVTSFVVEDSSYPEGRFAFFSNSQEQVAFGNYTIASLDGFAAWAGDDQAVAPGASAALSGSAELAVPPYECAWTAAGADAGSTCALSVTPAATTTYTLTVTDAFGRTASDQVTVTVGP